MEAKDSKFEESTTIEKDKVLLNREWTFWENYDSKSKEIKDYSTLTKELFTFNDKSIATPANINVIVIHEILAKLNEKFLKTLLKASLMLFPTILILFILCTLHFLYR